MNPFDLHGPEFLFFYILLSATVIGLLIWVRNQTESLRAPKMDLADPYLIAYLRGGKNEVLRVAIVSLVDRGLLVVSGEEIKCAKTASPNLVRTPLDKALLEKFTNKKAAASIFEDSTLGLIADQYDQSLKALGLLPDASVTAARTLRFVLALFFLVGVGGIKIMVALSRGRFNIFFLIILMTVAVGIASKVAFPRLTALGEAVLKDIQNLYSGLKNRAALINPGGATLEAVMLAAVFGVSALRSNAFVFTQTLFPRAQNSSGSSSSCGSSGSSSCGSSCGGGCGGGCGGCGS
jgi:uncharacterized protein (TIGR04222 family)